MATWPTPPKTWADGDIPDDDEMNAEIRDPHIILDQHSHSGADGDGSSDIVPDTVTLDDLGETPAAPGPNKLVVFSESETAKVRAGAAGAATVISLATHTHTPSDAADGETVEQTRQPLAATYNGDARVDHVYTPGGAGHASVCFTNVNIENRSAGVSTTAFWRLVYDGAEQVEESQFLDPLEFFVMAMSSTQIEPAASSTTIRGEGKESNTDAQGRSTVGFREVLAGTT